MRRLILCSLLFCPPGPFCLIQSLGHQPEFIVAVGCRTQPVVVVCDFFRFLKHIMKRESMNKLSERGLSGYSCADRNRE